MVYFVRRENWKKLMILLCGIVLPYVLPAQIAIGALDVPHSSAVLELITAEKGFLGPQVALKDIWDKKTVPNYTDGLLVLNMNDSNTEVPVGDRVVSGKYYYWSEDRWIPDIEKWLKNSNIIK